MTGEPSQLQVPELWCPIPPAVHPGAAALEEHAIGWMRRAGYVTSPEQEQEARGVAFGMLAALVYPYSTFEAAFGCDLMIWLFLTDDEYMERAAQRGDLGAYARHVLRSMAILRAPGDPPHDVPAGERLHPRALRELRLRLAELAGHEQVQRLVDGIAEYFALTGTEVILRSQGEQHSLTEYLTFRESSIVMRCGCFVVIEMGNDCPLSAGVWGRPEIQAVSRSAARVIAWTNDILSGVRELHWPGAINLVTVLADEYGCTLSEAVGLATEMHTKETEQFAALADRLRGENNDPYVDRYITGLGAWIRGNLDWSLFTHRYHVDQPRTGAEHPQTFGA